jgi:hypothetical protein
MSKKYNIHCRKCLDFTECKKENLALRLCESCRNRYLISKLTFKEFMKLDFFELLKIRYNETQ